jgi:membrane fusion protein, multidrug efflux system
MFGHSGAQPSCPGLVYNKRDSVVPNSFSGLDVYSHFFRRERMAVPLAWLSISVAAAMLLAGCGKQKMQGGGGMPPVPVSVAVAAKETVPVQIHAVGTVEPSSTVQIKSQVDGELVGVRFTEGSNVSQGELLFEIDARPYQEALREAQAAVARDRAQLSQAQANLARDQAQSKSADVEAKRDEQLAKEGMAPQMQADQQQATADAARAAVRADEAAIDSARASLEADQAAVARAQLNLNYCQIRSPMSGRAGNLLVHPGNLVKANDTALVVINRLEPIFVSFGVPEERLDAIKQRAAREKLAVQASSNNAPGRIATGVLTVIDNAVDTNTGTIRLKARFDNHERLLWPGQFVDVVLTLDTQQDATVVPSEAVQDGQHGPFIFVVKADQTVEPRMVTVSRTLGRKTVIAKGVAPGETVVTDGQLRLFPGARIHPVPASKVDNEAL